MTCQSLEAKLSMGQTSYIFEQAVRTQAKVGGIGQRVRTVKHMIATKISLPQVPIKVIMTFGIITLK